MKNRMLAAGIAATTAIWLVGSSLVPLAGAATVEELQAQITSLLAQITALQGQLAGGSTAGGCYTFTRSLTVGMSGADVTALQNYLSPTYFTSAATGYFGPITQAAVAAWQTAKGVAPAAGYWGPLSQAKYNAVCVPAEEGTGALSGTEGALTDFDNIASLSNEEVGEDETDVEVLGVEFKADGADQTIERVNVIIDNPVGGVSAKLGDYITDVSLWLDGKKLDTMDVSDASYDRAADEYTFRFTGLKGVVEDGAKAELTVAVSGVSNLDSDDVDGEWGVTIPEDGIRAASPNGATDTYDANAYEETFSLTTFATSNDVELKVKRSSDTPEEQIVIGDDNSEFDADLLAFTLTAEGSDITVYTLPVTLTAVGTGDEVDLADSLTLSCDGTDWSENVAAADVAFEDMELDIAEGDTVECLLTATMNEINGDTFVSGDSLTADVVADDIDAEDQTGEAVDTLTGTANGLEQTFINQGLALSNVDATKVVYTAAPDTGGVAVGKFTVEFDATAEGAEVWLPMDANPEYTVQAANGNDWALSSAVFECVADCGASADNSDTDFFIGEGDTETYRLTVYGASDEDSDNFKVWLDTVVWDFDDNTGGEDYTTGLGEGTSADTGYLFLEVVPAP